MNRRQLMQTLLAGGAAMGVSGTLRAASPPSVQRPNLLFVLPDQWRGQALGFLGEEPVLTPHLDRFATKRLPRTSTMRSRCECHS